MLQVGNGEVHLRKQENIFPSSILCFSVEELLFPILWFFFCFFFSLSTSLCRKSITEPRHSGHFQPECLRLLKRPLRGAFGTFPGLGSRPLSLFCSLCRPCSCYADRLARSAFHLLFASSCRKLTADVHT